MADRCVFFDDLLRVHRARQRSYVVLDPPGLGLACVDARARRGPDWWFARTWVRTQGTPRALYRVLDRLESLGFRFRVDTRPARGVGAHEVDAAGRALDRVDARASELLRGLGDDERMLHAELFPEEAALLARGYDWDRHGVYRRGVRLPADAYGRILDHEDAVLYEWVPVPEEFTWRRYPLQRTRTACTAPRT